jgi:hypothetical protein
MAATYQLIAKQTLTGTVASVTFSSIPQTYTDLLFCIAAGTTRDTNADGLYVTFNSSGGTYAWTQLVYATGSSPSSSGTITGFEKFVAAVSGGVDGSTTGATEIYLPGYRQSTAKSYSSTYTAMNDNAVDLGVVAGRWSDTSAITQVAFTAESARSLIAGSSFYLYGISNS